MAYNISGLVINKNYKDNLESLQKELGWFLQKEEEISFELASSNWKDNKICDIYFSEQGTLMFMSTDLCSEPLPVKRQNTLSFTLSESEMSFDLNYCERGALERSIMEVENNRITDDGEKLDIEDNTEDTAEIIWDQLGVVLGKSFWDIELEEKAVRYRFVCEEEFRKVEAETEVEAEVEAEAKVEENKWWEFWK